MTEHPRWKIALDKLWTRNRVHCGPDMSAAYRDLATIYDHTDVFDLPEARLFEGSVRVLSCL